jgi:hypothetical protein
VEAQDPERELIERALGHPVAATARAAWGFTNRTDMVTLAGGQRAVVQRYRHREDAGYRLQVMQGLSGPAIEAEPLLGERVQTLQVLRMMEQLASGNLTPGIADIVTDRLHAALT